MTELEQRLRTIVTEKEERLLPENLKAGITCLGVEGEYEIPTLKNTFHGETNTLNDTINRVMISDFKIVGITRQDNTPTSDTIAVIQNVSNDIVTETMSNNILTYPYDEETTTVNDVTGVVNMDGSVTLNGTAKNGLTNVFSFHHRNNKTYSLPAGTYSFAFFGNLPEHAIGVVHDGTSYYTTDDVSHTFTLKDTTYLTVYIQSDVAGITFDDVKVYPVIVKGDVVPVGHYSTITHRYAIIQRMIFPLGITTLKKDDYLADDGIHVTRSHIVYDGTEDWYFHDTFSRFILEDRPDNCPRSDLGHEMLCSHYNRGDTETDDMVFNIGNVAVYVKDSRYTTAAAWKAHLAEQYAAGTPVTIEYTLITPEVIPYTADQQAAWDDLKYLSTCEDMTIITTTNNIKPILSGKYDISKEAVEADENLIPENIKSGVTIFDVAGSFTNDATATSNDLREGKTAYVDGEKIEGTLNRVTYVSNASNDGFVNTANIDVVDFEGMQYFTITSNNPYMSNEETDESIVLTEGYIGPGGDNVNQVTLCKEVSEVADAIGLTSDKIVSGNTILGVEGTAEVGTSVDGAKIFETIDEMNTSTNNADGDLAIVYGTTLQNVTVDSVFTKATFPNTVVLPAAFEELQELSFKSTDESTIIYGELSGTGFELQIGEDILSYISSDGITYTREDDLGENIDFGVELSFAYTENWKDEIGYFIQIETEKCEGVYKYNGTTSQYVEILS